MLPRRGKLNHRAASPPWTALSPPPKTAHHRRDYVPRSANVVFRFVPPRRCKSRREVRQIQGVPSPSLLTRNRNGEIGVFTRVLVLFTIFGRVVNSKIAYQMGAMIFPIVCGSVLKSLRGGEPWQKPY